VPRASGRETRVEGGHRVQLNLGEGIRTGTNCEREEVTFVHHTIECQYLEDFLQLGRVNANLKGEIGSGKSERMGGDFWGAEKRKKKDPIGKIMV